MRVIEARTVWNPLGVIGLIVFAFAPSVAAAAIVLGNPSPWLLLICSISTPIAIVAILCGKVTHIRRVSLNSPNLDNLTWDDLK